MAHWHDFNPWAQEVVYLPDLEEVARACFPKRPVEVTIKHWSQYGNLVDAYILPQPSGFHDIGIRFGEEPEDYFSPHCDKKVAQALLDKYGPTGPTINH